MFKLNPFSGNLDYFESISTLQQVFAGDYASIQDAVDEVTGRDEASSATGCVVWIPPGDYSASSVVVKANVSLIGIAPGTVKLGTLEYRPSSDVTGPGFAVLQNLLVGTLLVTTETAASSGVYNPDMFIEGVQAAYGLKVINCYFDTDVTLKALASASFDKCHFYNATTTIFNAGPAIRFSHCNWDLGANSSIDISANSNSPQIPTTLDGSVTFLYCECPPITLSTPVGVVQAGANLLLCYLNTATVGANTFLNIFATEIGTDPTVNVAGSLFSGAKIGYTPTTSTDWNSPTITDVGAALDELAARVKALGG